MKLSNKMIKNLRDIFEEGIDDILEDMNETYMEPFNNSPNRYINTDGDIFENELEEFQDILIEAFDEWINFLKSQ